MPEEGPEGFPGFLRLPCRTFQRSAKRRKGGCADFAYPRMRIPSRNFSEVSQEGNNRVCKICTPSYRDHREKLSGGLPEEESIARDEEVNAIHYFDGVGVFAFLGR